MLTDLDKAKIKLLDKIIAKKKAKEDYSEVLKELLLIYKKKDGWMNA